MIAYQKLIDAVLDACAVAVPEVTVGALPPLGGTAVTPQAGYATSTFLNKGTVNSMSFTCNCKKLSQTEAIGNISMIHNALVKTLSYTSGDSFQILNIDASMPTFIELEETGKYWIYGSTITVNWLWR